MIAPSSGAAHGRPREFEFAAALDAALGVFWRGGYAATSLDELTAAMGLSRSSFYGAFGSKHDVLLAAVRRYVDNIFMSLEAIAASEPDALSAVRAIIASLANPPSGEQGCLLVNSIAELAPEDAELSILARMHIERVVKLLGTLLEHADYAAEAAGSLASALLAFVFGATTLRKAGMSEGVVTGVIQQVNGLLATAIRPAPPSPGSP